MTDARPRADALASHDSPHAAPSARRDDEPMTDLQIAELRGLADRIGEPFAATHTRREARERILFLRARLQDCFGFQ